jgi:HEPN domain-containing protein
MKEQADLVRGLLRKASSDLLAVDATLAAGANDAAAFHAQQAVEKLLKAYLASEGVDFPFTHNLSKLVELCSEVDTAFQALIPIVEPLTPYAVELRYDSDFWPTAQEASEARDFALAARDFVLALLPTSLTTED